MIYDKFPERALEIGGIDQIGVAGVVSSKNETAVMYGGHKIIKKYYDGTKKAALILTVTAIGRLEDQKELVEKICSAMEKLVKGKWDIDGISQPKCKITSMPVPTQRNEHFWIYSGSVQIEFYTREEI